MRASGPAVPHSLSAKLGLGTVQFGLPYGVSNQTGQIGEAEARAILSRAAAAGLSYLDTAAQYGNAEERLRAALPKDHPFRIATKTLPLKSGIGQILERARESAVRFGAIDTLLVHHAADLRAPEGPALWRELQALKRDGAIRRLGISCYVEDEPLALAEHYAPDAIQIPFSLLDQRLAAGGQLAALKAQGIEIVARSIFLQGAMLMDPAALPSPLAALAAHFRALRSAADAAGTHVLAAALAFVLGHDLVDIAVVGVTSIGEFEQILNAAAESSPIADPDRWAIQDARLLNPAKWGAD